MKFFCGYGTLFFYNPFFVKKILVFFTFCFIRQYTISAQHTKTIIVSKDCILYNSTIASTLLRNYFHCVLKKKGLFWLDKKLLLPQTQQQLMHAIIQQKILY